MHGKPFDGAITAFYDQDFPPELRREIEEADKSRILSKTYPYETRMKGKAYDAEFDLLQIELVKLLSWVRATGARVAVLFEGRDAAGKGGAIKRFRENLNPRNARVVALGKPSDVERGQWYFQRYVEHLPGPGEIVFFDRSWYNRAVVERVFDFSTDEERRQFFRQVPDFEQMLIADGIHLFKIWLTVSRAEQMRRFLARESDPLKQWKLSPIDKDSLSRWDQYTTAIEDELSAVMSEEELERLRGGGTEQADTESAESPAGGPEGQPAREDRQDGGGQPPSSPETQPQSDRGPDHSATTRSSQ